MSVAGRATRHTNHRGRAGIAVGVVLTGLVGLAGLVGLVGCSSDSDSGASTSGPGAAAGTVAGATSGNPDDIRQGVLVALTNDVMVPAYQRMSDAAATLLADIEAMCAAPGPSADRNTAQTSWSVARGAWLATRAFRFGPATTLRTMSTIDFPIDATKIDALIAGDEIFTETSLDALGSDQRGLGGIEHVLFGPEPLDAQACSYLVSAAMLVADAAASVLRGWTTTTDGEQSFADQLINPGQGGMYATGHEAYEDLINSMIFAIADVADARIGRASGDVTGTPLPEQIDAGLAHRAKQDAIDVVAGVRALYVGAAAGGGIRDLVASISAETATAMDTNLDAAIAALEALPSPLADATDPGPAHTAYEALKQAQVVLRAEIASQLGVTLTFGDADGDS